MAYTSTIQKISESLKETYKNTIFSNPGNVGDSREKAVIEYLQKVMPHKYGFSSGEVFDKDDINAGQIDVIIYDNVFSTVFTDGTDKIFAPVESTFGVISVKSKMGIKELDHAIEGIKKYDLLSRPSPGKDTLQIMPDFALSFGNAMSLSKATQQRNINCIFAFDTTVATETLLQKVKDAGCIDLIVVPNKFCVIGRHREEFGLNNSGSKLENSAILHDSAIGLFTLLLQIYLSNNHLIARDVKDLILEIVRKSDIHLIP